MLWALTPVVLPRGPQGGGPTQRNFLPHFLRGIERGIIFGFFFLPPPIMLKLSGITVFEETPTVALSFSISYDDLIV